jgi:hypothetical protein
MCEPVPEPIPEPVAETPVETGSVPVEDEEHILDLSDYTTPEYMEMVKKLLEKTDDTNEVSMSKKTFKIPGYTSIQMSNTSKQPRRKSMTFL